VPVWLYENQMSGLISFLQETNVMVSDLRAFFKKWAFANAYWLTWQVLLSLHGKLNHVLGVFVQARNAAL